MELVLNQLNLVARDFDAALAFYRLLGLEVPDGPPSTDGIRHAEVTLPNGFVLELDNLPLARTYNAALLTGAGYEGRQPPYDTFWGARYAVVADPDGNDVGIMSPQEDGRRSWPPRESPAP
jgi:catechol 2,3-dioxygenase-like lactoylglutathione lyase family enzyme